MLKKHMDALEDALLSVSKIPASSGHALHKGTPREAFIKEFLANHLSQRVALGTGEIIDANSRPGEQRNQIDIVIYKPDYPKLDFGGGVNGFLAESVVATIEVKSVLNKREFGDSVGAARNVKGLQRSLTQSFQAGYHPPGILSYIVAYDGPARMQTIHGWIQPAYETHGISCPAMGGTGEERQQVASPAIDGVFVLGKGFLYFDNMPVGFVKDEIRADRPDIRWVVADSPNGNLLLLFLFLTIATSGISGSWLNPMPYVTQFSVPGIELRP